MPRLGSETRLLSPDWYPLYKSGQYYFANSPGAASTNGALGNGTLRLTSFVVTNSVSLTRIGVEFTVAGEANSVYRLGIYGDDGFGMPTGAPLLDAGTISTGTGNAGNVATGGTPGVYEITISLTLQPGLYWIGGVAQSSPTTQPTMRIASSTSVIAPQPVQAIPSSNMVQSGYSMTGVSGALSTWVLNTNASNVPRVFFKVA